MADADEIHTNNFVDDDGNDSDDDGANTASENPVIKIFRGFPKVSDETISKIRESGLLQQDLSALSNEDLVLFGVTDEATRDEMVSQFTTTPNQLMNYDKYVEEMNKEKYQETVCDNVLRELCLMDMTLQATQMTLKGCPVTHDKIVTNDVYVSSLNSLAMKEILKVIAQITKDNTKSNKRNIWTYAIAGAALFASMAILLKVIKN